MFGLFKEKKTEDIHPEQYAPGTHIAYHDDLIDQLIADHKKILAIYDNTANAYNEDEEGILVEQLHLLKIELTSHLLKENTKLYVYLKSMYRNNAENKELISRMQKDMSKISRLIFDFLNRCGEAGMVFDTKFKKELDTMGHVLRTLIEAEESTLYPLYLPLADYA